MEKMKHRSNEVKTVGDLAKELLKIIQENSTLTQPKQKTN